MSLEAQLGAGDVLLYRGTGVYGWFIRRHTGHPIGHVEVFVGAGQSFASRNGIGVNFYPLRTNDLRYVCRPNRPFDLDAGIAWGNTQMGTPYGWLDLLQFADYDVDGKGYVCSPAAAMFQEEMKLNPFNGEPPMKIAPFQFLTSNVYDIYDVTVDGLVRPRVRPVTIGV